MGSWLAHLAQREVDAAALGRGGEDAPEDEAIGVERVVQLRMQLREPLLRAPIIFEHAGAHQDLLPERRLAHPAIELLPVAREGHGVRPVAAQ